MRKSLSKCEAWRIAWLLTLLLICSFAHADKFTYVYTAPDGTVLAEADEQGNITKTYDYRPYGEQALGQPPGGPGYTGHVNDPDTGLVYMQARYYDPEMGRFLSPDPAGSKPGNTFGFNRYAYANNNPILNVDPNGRQTIPLANRLGTDNPSITDAYFSTQANFAVSLFCGCDASYHAPPGSGAVQSVLTPIETSLAGAAVSRALGAAQVAAKTTSATESLAESQLSKEAQRGIRSLERQIAAHEKKLTEFKANPTVRPGMENLSEELIKQQQKSRIQHLEKEIRTFKDNIQKIKEGQLSQ